MQSARPLEVTREVHMTDRHLLTAITRATLVAAALGAAWIPATAQTAASATPPTGFSAKPVLSSPITGVEGKQAVLMSVTLAPGASSPFHQHPGDCFGSVIEGVIELRIQGLAPRRVEAGQSYATLGGVPHEFVNVGDKAVRMLNALVIDKDRPPSSPAAR
jgi:quercetin dioxygenase-like cupin family protein